MENERSELEELEQGVQWLMQTQQEILAIVRQILANQSPLPLRSIAFKFEKER